MEKHSAVVRPIALHYCRCTPEPLDDLIQVGLLGLIRAAELYRGEHGTPFEAFARPHIRGAILHHLRDSCQAVRLPRRQAERLEKLQRLQRQAGSCTPQELWKQVVALGIDPLEASVLLRQRRLNRPLALLPELEEAISEAHRPGSLGRGTLPEETPMQASVLLEGLEPRVRLVVEQVVLHGSSYRSLGSRLGVSPMTIQRLLHRGLETLRLKLDQRQAGGLTVPSCDRGRSGPRGC